MQITSTTPLTIDGQAVTPPPQGWQPIKVKELNPLRPYKSARDLAPLVLESSTTHLHEGREYPLALITAHYGFNRQGQFIMVCTLSRLDKEGFSDSFYSYNSRPLEDGWHIRYLIDDTTKEPARYTVKAKSELLTKALKNLAPLYQYAQNLTF